MPTDIKELKMYLKYCKKALKMINRMYKWPYIPLKQPLFEKKHLENLIEVYTTQIKLLKRK